MANWCGTARSNYFEVKNADLFEAWAKNLYLEVWVGDAPGLYAISPDDGGDGDWPSWDAEKDDEVDFIAELAAHLANGSVCVLIAAGAEKKRYVTGVAQAFTNEGKVVDMSLTDIYQKAFDTFGIRPTAAEY